MKYLSIPLFLLVSLAVQAGEADKREELQSILSSIAEEIAFEPYLGNLRSTEFVEQSKKANAFDRSMLLLEKLKAAGYRAHIAKGELLDQHKNTLIATIADEPVSNLYSTASLSMDKALAAHYWVEVLLDNRLVAMDATFPDAVLGQSFGVKNGVVTSLDPYQYKFRLVYKLKNRSGRVVVLGTYASTTSLQGMEPISLVTTAEPIMAVVGKKTGLLGGGLSGIAGGLAGGRSDSSSKDATIIGKRYRTNLILKNGVRKLGHYKSTFNIKGAAIEKEWLEITLTYPGEKPVVVTRPLFTAGPNAIPPDYRQQTINILPGAIPLELARGVLHSITDLQSESAGLSTPPNVEQAVSVNNRLAPRVGFMVNLSIAALSDHQTEKVAKHNLLVPVYDKPRIYITMLEGRLDPATEVLTFELSFDYRVDDISAYYWQEEERALGYFFALARGLLQSTLEGVMLDRLQSGNGYSATDIMLNAQEQGIGEYVITPNTVDSIKSLTALSALAKKRLVKTVEAGYYIIIPEKPVLLGEETYWAWWQLDPTTGKTLGVLENGLHGAFVEYSIVEREVAVSDERGFVLGLLTGANSASMMIMSHLLGGGSLDESTLSAIEHKLQQLACSSCFSSGIGVEFSLSVSGNISCFELYKIIAFEKSHDLIEPMPFCDAYAAGFDCAVQMVLNKVGNKSSMNLNDPVSINTNLSCQDQ